MEKYIKVWIKSESDLPKENRPYIVGYKRMDYDNGERDGWLGYFVKDNYYKKLWLRDIDYYLQPISDTELIVSSDETSDQPTRSLRTVLEEFLYDYLKIQSKSNSDKNEYNEYNEYCKRVSSVFVNEYLNKPRQ